MDLINEFINNGDSLVLNNLRVIFSPPFPFQVQKFNRIYPGLLAYLFCARAPPPAGACLWFSFTQLR